MPKMLWSETGLILETEDTRIHVAWEKVERIAVDMIRERAQYEQALVTRHVLERYKDQ